MCADGGDEDGWMRLLIATWQGAKADFRCDGAVELHAPGRALHVVGWGLRPDALHQLDQLDHSATAFGLVERAEQFKIGGQRTGADAEQKAPVSHVVELRDLGRDDRRMAVGQGKHARRER